MATKKKPTAKKAAAPGLKPAPAKKRLTSKMVGRLASPAKKPAAAKKAAAAKPPRGLAAALPLEQAISLRPDRTELAHDRLYAWSQQPRSVISLESAQNQAAAIAAVDAVLEPLIVRHNGVTDADGKKYEIVAGERRWRGVGVLILDGRWPADRPLPVEIHHGMTEERMLWVATLENMAREELHPLEEAMSFQRLITFGATKASLARDLKWTERQIYRRLDLLKLTPLVQQALREQRITLQQAEAFAAGTAERQERHLEVMTKWPNLASADAIEHAMKAAQDPVLSQIDRTIKDLGQAVVRHETIGGGDLGFEDEEPAPRLPGVTDTAERQAPAAFAPPTSEPKSAAAGGVEQWRIVLEPMFDDAVRWLVIEDRGPVLPVRNICSGAVEDEPPAPSPYFLAVKAAMDAAREINAAAFPMPAGDEPLPAMKDLLAETHQ